MNHYNSQDDFFGTDNRNIRNSIDTQRTSSYDDFDTPYYDMKPSAVGSGHASATAAADRTLAGACIARAYLYMFIGVMLSGIAAVVAYNVLDYSDPNTFSLLFGAIIAELIVFGIASYNVAHGNTTMTGIMFYLYSVLSGISLSILFVTYQADSIIAIFFVAAGMFGVLALAGSITKHDLTILGQIGIMLIVGVLLMMIANIFIGSERFDIQISMIGLAAFIGVTAYDAQKLKNRAMMCSNEKMVNAVAMTCALELYLDFINIFLKLLRLFGRRK